MKNEMNMLPNTTKSNLISNEKLAKAKPKMNMEMVKITAIKTLDRDFR